MLIFEFVQLCRCSKSMDGRLVEDFYLLARYSDRSLIYTGCFNVLMCFLYSTRTSARAVD